MTDNDYILRCIELAKNGMHYVAPNPMVGALLVVNANQLIANGQQLKAGDIFAEGWHRKFGEGHAEVECFRAADRRMAGLSAAAARLGVSRTQLREVVLGNRQSKRLMARIRAAGIKVEEGK